MKTPDPFSLLMCWPKEAAMMWTRWDGWNHGALALILAYSTTFVAGIGDVRGIVLCLPFALLGILLVVGVGRTASIGFVKGALIGSGTTLGLCTFLSLYDSHGTIVSTAGMGLFAGILYGAVLSAAKGYRLGWIVLLIMAAYVFVSLLCSVG
jgi:hypothetical protein